MSKVGRVERNLEGAMHLCDMGLAPWLEFEARRVDCINSIVHSIASRIRDGKLDLKERVDLYRKIAREEVPRDDGKRIISEESRFICLLPLGLYAENRLDHDGIPIAYRWGPIVVERVPVNSHQFSDQNVAILSNLVSYVRQSYNIPKPI
jgi:hypothetical protein